MLDPGIPHASASYRHFLKLVKSKHIKYHLAVRNQLIDFGDGVKAQVENPPQTKLEGTPDDVNNNSAVIRFTYGRSSLLLMGDAGVEAEKDMMQSGVVIKSDVVKIGHHGSNTATGDDWLDAVRPRLAVISVGKKNSFGHPSRKVLRKLSSRGIKVFRTDRNGAVSVRFSENGYGVSSYRLIAQD